MGRNEKTPPYGGLQRVNLRVGTGERTRERPTGNGGDL